jgi:hypothetical protein
MRQPPSLADRVLAALPGFEHAPLARDMAARLNTDEPHVRQAFERLESEGRAKIVRRGRGLHLVPADYPGKICPICRVEYVLPKKSKRHTCSRSCSMAWSWRQPGTAERRHEALLAAHRTPESRAKKVENNKKRWAKPGEREKLSEQNRQRWADPYQNAKQSVGIARSRTPEANAAISKRMKDRWASPEGRKLMEETAALGNAKASSAANRGAAMKRRWEDPEQRAKFAKSLARATAKAAEVTRGRKQSPEHIQKRIKTRKVGAHE